MGGKEVKPLLKECEIEIVESVLESQAPKSVLEWGSGWSTVYWPPRFDCVQRWVAIEHDRGWYERIEGRVDGKVDLRLVEREDYYVPVLWEPGGFDLIFVDGLYRRACLIAAAAVVEPGGVVVLHDAGRLEYRASWGLWPEHELLYRGEFPWGGPGEYVAFGLCVFWRDGNVRTEDWCRDYSVR